jgi:hypothetical protein
MMATPMQLSTTEVTAAAIMVGYSKPLLMAILPGLHSYVQQPVYQLDRSIQDTDNTRVSAK